MRNFWNSDRPMFSLLGKATETPPIDKRALWFGGINLLFLFGGLYYLSGGKMESPEKQRQKFQARSEHTVAFGDLLDELRRRRFLLERLEQEELMKEAKQETS